jgi:hypothetical protein
MDNSETIRNLVEKAKSKSKTFEESEEKKVDTV